MMHLTKMQREASELAWMEREAKKRRAEEQAKADRAAKRKAMLDARPSDWDIEVQAWERDGIEWLKAGEKLFGPRYDYQMELGRLARFYSVARALPYEHHNALGVIASAGVRTIVVHGLLTLFLSLVALIFGAPLWLCVAAGSIYLVWRFLLRREWILLKRAEAHELRKGSFPSRGEANDA